MAMWLLGVGIPVQLLSGTSTRAEIVVTGLKVVIVVISFREYLFHSASWQSC